ncbi:DUF3347 domain-containing protein [Chitinophaga horti]|uniref:DUF3347 domain-containing protein n=1 Tax=Chitinophaga horti TaxID=2920382 RepID=A0ABY6JAJ5_9BACT|nr:DUF3347 domain-containing protein [Chitinophaga horti]UYQ95199.1 DUF3347 domain-containing protein [Chitinophaga horti]
MGLKLLGLAAVAGLLTMSACQQQGKTGETAAADEQAAFQAPYPGVFYDSLKGALTNYYHLSGSLVAANTIKANDAALSLKSSIDSLPVDVLRSDSAIFTLVKSTTGDISAELTGLMGETDLEKKRASYQMVSDMLFDLIKATGLKGQTVYRQYCPMAFDDKGAYWLSDQTEIRNPYFGDEMLTCGAVTDTLRYQ